ncbi:MAG: sulfatase-like hydrolase/transferase [Opitutaceae bacterium]|nr:sulfatase-like hydrolase/transferase [Opitutaceae bacterium]
MSQPSHIVLVLTTQWRWDMLGCTGHPQVRTPELDALVARGRLYTQAVTPHPFGPMSRAALMTGVPSPRNGVKEYYDPLPAHCLTLARRMQAFGYRTAFFGKWHLAARDQKAPLVGESHARMIVPPQNRGGFDFWEGFESGFLLNDPWLHGSRLPQPVQVRGYQSDVLCERAAAWWRERRDDKPTLLVVSLEAPHPPYAAAAPVGESPTPESLELPANVPRGALEPRVRAELAGYLRHIQATDAAIGRLWRMVSLANEPIRFVFTSVHGDMHGSHGLFRKGWPFEESVRVPFLVADSGHVDAAREERPFSLLYVNELFSSWAVGRERELTGDPVPIGMPSVVRLPWQCNYTWRGLRDAKHKVVLNESDALLFYFDLESDPYELKNLANDPRRSVEAAAWRRKALQLAADYF